MWDCWESVGSPWFHSLMRKLHGTDILTSLFFSDFALSCLVYQRGWNIIFITTHLFFGQMFVSLGYEQWKNLSFCWNGFKNLFMHKPYIHITLTSVDLCAVNPCQNGGSCVVETSGILCICTEGFTGDTCRDTGIVLTQEKYMCC